MPSPGWRPWASFQRLFQSKAHLSAFSTAADPPSTKNRCGSSGSPSTRRNVSTNSARWTVYMSELAGLLAATLPSSATNSGSSANGFIPSGDDAKNV